ncbi:MAG: hypothetical protein AAF756_21230 [Pseudomonadota bacterium]
MINYLNRLGGGVLFSALAVLFASATAQADSIDPAAFTADLDVGESVTIRKTVTVDTALDTGLIDVMFLFDTSGSMGDEIDAAKAAAADILTGLSAFGDLASGTGYYSEPGAEGLFRDLSTDTTTQLASIDAITLGLGGGGGDFPELGFEGVEEAAEGASWRPGSNRFVIAFGDATFKELNGFTEASALEALNDNNATFLGLDFGSMLSSIGITPQFLADETGGSITDSSASASEIVDDIVALVDTAVSEYSAVTLDDFSAGLPNITLDVECVSADIGTCDGAFARGDFDRSTDRDFMFDVTFTRVAAGSTSFDTFALVDGAIVAAERDTFPGSTGGGGPRVPAPGAAYLLALGLLLLRRRAVRA